jgi:hypothetical protein
LTSQQGGNVDVVAEFDSISKCHVALTQTGFNKDTDNMFCLIMEPGVDWKIF